MQVRFYNKTYSFNTKAELGKVLDDIYYYYQDLRKEIPRKYQQKIDNELQKLERDFEDTYRKVRNMESDLKNSKGENMNYYEKIIQEKRERQNDKVVEKYTKDRAEIEIIKTDSGSYKAKVYKDGITKEIATVTMSLSEAKHIAELYSKKMQNSKGENMNYYEKIIEEKKNAKQKKNSTFDEVRKFTYKECLVTILQLNTGMFSGRYTFSITKDGREELSKDVSTSQQEAERKAKREVETVWNEKENADLVAEESYGKFTIKVFKFDGNKYSYYSYPKGSSMSLSYASGNATSERDALDKAKRALDSHNNEKTNSTVIRGTIHGHKYEVDRMSDGSYMGYVYDEEDYPIYKTSLYSSAAEAEKEIKSKIFNSKEEKGYYAQIVERKNANLFDIALALIGKKVPVQEAVRELTDTYGLSKHEAYKLLEKAATHLEEARRAKVLHENK